VSCRFDRVDLRALCQHRQCAGMVYPSAIPQMSQAGTARAFSVFIESLEMPWLFVFPRRFAIFRMRSSHRRVLAEGDRICEALVPQRTLLRAPGETVCALRRKPLPDDDCIWFLLQCSARQGSI